MPDKLWPVAFLEEVRRLRLRRTWLEPRPVYLAAVLVMTAAVLMVLIVGGVKQSARPVPTDPAVRQQATSSPEPVLRAQSPVIAEQAEVKPQKPSSRDGVQAVDKPRVEAPRQPAEGEVKLAFGWQLHPLFGDWRYHPGVDIMATQGGVIKAMWGGRVIDVYEDRRWGLTVVVVGGGYTVYYGSLAETKLDKGALVSAGTGIGKAGQAAAEPYPHLHLAVKKGDDYVDPQEIIAVSER